MLNVFRYGLALVAVAGLTSVAAFAGERYGLPEGEASAHGMSAAKLGEIRTPIQKLVDDGKLAGAIAAVARDGEIVYFDMIGMMDAGRGKPMQADTIFRMYSMTKPITGAAVMILVEEGKVSLSDPVSKYIPEFAELQIYKSEDETVMAKNVMTIKHLMMHTSGLSYGFQTDAVGKLYQEHDVNSDGASGYSLEEFAKRVAEMPILFEPGTKWNYSVAMDVLGRVVEVATGQRYGDFLQARIFGPLNMKDSGFMVPADKQDRFAANYGPGEGGKMTVVDDPATSRYLNAPSQDSGGGGMVGTAADYIRFAQMLLNEGELDGVRIISAESAREMTTNQMGPEFGDAPLNLFPGMKFTGMGFGYCGAAIMDGYKTTLFGPEGVYSWGGAASTDFWIDRHEKLVGIVLTQFMPTASHPTRSIVQNGAYAALETRYGVAGGQ